MTGLKRIISFSVYGDDKVYHAGAIANAIAAKQFFPGWSTRFYVDERLQGLVETLLSLDAEVLLMKRLHEVDGMFWRFLATADSDVDAVIIRDVDALLCPRNKAAVDEWLVSGLRCHIIRDHPGHRHLIPGGLWGVRGGVLHEMPDLIMRWNEFDHYGDDIRFLSQVIYPQIVGNALVHSEFVAFDDEIVGPIKYQRYNDTWLGCPPSRSDVTRIRREDFLLRSKSGLVRLQSKDEWDFANNR